MKTELEIIAEANKVKAMGSPLTIEQLISVITKKENGAAKASKRRDKSASEREMKATFAPSTDKRTTHEILLDNAKKNLPSSLR